MVNKIQLHHLFRLLGQMVNAPAFGITGGYHGGNLGDIALGMSVKLILEEMKLSGGLQTLYNLDTLPWPKTKYTIVGGGAIGYSDSLKRIINKVGAANYKKVAFLGVDFNEKTYGEDIVTMLKESAWISCRNEFQANKLSAITDRTDITFHPDLVFSYNKELCKKQRSSAKEKKLLMNLVPLYGNLVNGKWEPEQAYKDERPELYETYDTMVAGYTNGARQMVEEHLKMGYEVETVQFTPEDEVSAKFILQGLPVKHHKYSDNIDEMLTIIGKAERVFATRYHATILSVKAGAEIIPMAYAVKNEKLLNELGVDSSRFISSTDLAKGVAVFPPAFKIDDSIVTKWEAASHLGIQNCIKKLIEVNG